MTGNNGSILEEVIEVLSTLKSEGELFIALTPPFATSIEIDRKVLDRELEKQGLTEQEFRSSINEINLILLHILNDEVTPYVNSRVQDAMDLLNEDAARSQVSERVELVRSRLYDEGLQRRYDTKRSSKAPSFSQIDWDIKVKHFDAGVDLVAPFPYATVRLSFQRDFDASFLTVLGGRIFDSVQVNFSKDEIDYLTRVLATAKEHLEELELMYGNRNEC